MSKTTTTKSAQETAVSAGAVCRQRPRLSKTKKLVFATVTCASLVLVLEIVLRMLDPQMIHFMGDYERVHQYARWHDTDLMPSTAVDWHLRRPDGSDLFKITVKTNAYGMRDRELTSDDARGRTIVHCIGDSFTMGWGVEGSQSYPSQLADLLGEKYLVLNLGVDGFGLLAAREKSNRLGDLFPPDIVVYVLCANDVEDDELTHSICRRSPFQHRVHEAWDWLRERSYVVRLPDALVFWLMIPGLRGSDEDSSAQLAPAELRAMAARQALTANKTTQALEELRRDCESRGRRLVVVLLGQPYPELLNMLRFCDERHFDPLIFMLDHDRTIAGDGHLTPDGNRQLAELVADRIAGSASAPTATDDDR